jgi:hypothetical protein
MDIMAAVSPMHTPGRQSERFRGMRGSRQRTYETNDKPDLSSVYDLPELRPQPLCSYFSVRATMRRVGCLGTPYPSALEWHTSCRVEHVITNSRKVLITTVSSVDVSKTFLSANWNTPNLLELVVNIHVIA